MKHYEALPQVWVRNYESGDWATAYLMEELGEGIYTYRCILKCDGTIWNFRYMTTKDPHAKKTRPMHPFEAKAWCDENDAQMVYSYQGDILQIAMTIRCGEKSENYRHIKNSKLKKLKGQITWDDCSEFPGVEE